MARSPRFKPFDVRHRPLIDPHVPDIDPRGDDCRMAPPPPTCYALAAVLLWSVSVAGQGPVISLEHASALKATYPFVRFSTLGTFDLPQADGFTHAPRPDSSPAQTLALPEDVVALHGKQVSVRGFMLPVDVTAEGVRTFVLTASIDSCHWGMVGLPNEWVLVDMAGEHRVPFIKFQPVTVFGRLSVEPKWRGASLAGLYHIRAEHIAAEAF